MITRVSRSVLQSARLTRRTAVLAVRNASTASSTEQQTSPEKTGLEAEAKKLATSSSTVSPKSVLEADEELRRKMSGLAGDGGEAGVEYEDGQPVAMKRSVKNNMFRYI